VQVDGGVDVAVRRRRRQAVNVGDNDNVNLNGRTRAAVQLGCGDLALRKRAGVANAGGGAYRVAMRIAPAIAGWVVGTVVMMAAAVAFADLSKGLSLEQIRGVMRSHAREFTACHRTATKQHKRLHGPFVYQIEVDKRGKVVSARPFQASPVPAFDRCITTILLRARFPGGPASVETPLIFEPS
jgi:hypothetical protein